MKTRQQEVAEILAEQGSKSYLSSEEIADIILNDVFRRVYSISSERTEIIDIIKKYREASMTDLEKHSSKILEIANKKTVDDYDFTFGLNSSYFYGKL